MTSAPFFVLEFTPHPSATLLGFGFASSWMLLWTFAAAIPILLHFLAKRRSITVPWAAMHLLQQVLEKESKRIRIEQLILLAIRTCVMLLLAFALARPFFNISATDAVLGSVQQRWLRIFVLDLSYSMQFKEGDISSLQRAKSIAVEQIRSCNETDAFAVVELNTAHAALLPQQNASQLQQPTRRPTMDRDLTIARIQQLQSRDTGANLEPAIQQVIHLIEEASKDPSLPTRVQVHVLSDMGSDTWSESPSQKQSLQQLAKIAEIKIQSVAAASRENLAVTEVSTQSDFFSRGESAQVSARILNASLRATAEIPVRLLLDGRVVARESVRIPPQGETLVNFSATLNTSGYQVLTVQLDDDPLEVDNQRSQIVEVREAARILFIENEFDATRLIRLALGEETDSPAVDNSRRTTFDADKTLEFVRYSSFKTLSTDLLEFDAVFCTDQTSLDAELIAKLANYVRKGGGLVVTLGPNSNASQWNTLLEETELLGFRLAEPSGIENWNLDPLGYESPVLSPFEGFPDAGLLTTPLFRFWKIENIDEALQVDLGIMNQGPLLTRFDFGRGIVASLLSTPASGIEIDDASNWNAIATWPSFVPLMRQLLQTLLDERSSRLNATVGEVLTGFSDEDRSTIVQLTDPAGTRFRLSTERLDDADFGWFFSNTSKSGVYRLQQNQQSTPYAINLKADESRLETSRVPTFASPDFGDVTESSSEELPTDNWPATACLVGLVLLLASEAIVALLFGKRVQ
ncbi:MAG: BatA domain-containing protein [Pirellulaceae bacterium]